MSYSVIKRRKVSICEYLRFRVYDVLPENNMEVDGVEMRFKASCQQYKRSGYQHHLQVGLRRR